MHTALSAILRRVLPLVLFALLLAPAHAAEPKITFNLPAGEAGKTLKQFAAQAKREIMFPVQRIDSVPTNAVQGELTVRESLDRLLAGTELRAIEDTKTGALVVQRADDPNAQRAIANSDRPTEPNKVEDGKLVLDKVEVTGTRIRGLMGEADFNPMLSFTRSDIERAGVSSIGELSRLIPQSYSQGSYEGIGFGGQATGLTPNIDGSVASTTSTSRSTFNFRGLGGANTLVLIDGRRVAKSGIIRGNDAADLAGLPVSSIERVEVVLNGASAIYGSDAVGGVINIILRKNYNGTEVALSYENSFDSDTAVRTVTVTQGLRAGKLRAMLSGTWQDRHAFGAVDRYFTATDAWVTLGGTTNLTSYNSGGFAVGAGVVQAQSGTLPGLTSASAYARIPNGATGALLPAASYVPTTVSADLGDRAPYVNLIAPQVNRNGSVRLTYDIAAGHEVFLDGRYSDTETDIEGLPVNYRGFLEVPADYPGNPFGVPVFLQKTFWELGNIQGAKTAKTSNAALSAGFRGPLPWGDWRYEASADWNRAILHDKNVYDPVLQTTLYNAAIAARNLVLFYDSRTSQPNDLNLLRSFLRPGDRLDHETSLTYSASADGTIWNLPAGPMGVALGLETRQEKARTSQAVAENPLINLSLLGEFKRTNDSAFAEVRIPVLGAKQSVPLVDRLDLTAAARYDRYSDIGGDTSPGYGVTWRPVSWLLFRASRNYSFRAPGLQALYRPVTNSIIGTSPTIPQLQVFDRLRNNQLLTGVFPSIIGGNLGLKPERSVSDNVGMVVNVPGALLKGLSFSVDAQILDYKDRISGLSFQQIIDLFPERLTRGPNLPGDPAGIPGPITSVDTRSANIAKLEVQTIDYQLNYQRETSWGRFDARLALTDYQKYLATTVPGTTPISTLFQYPTRLSWQTYWNKNAYGLGVSGFYQEKQYLNLTYTTVRFRCAMEWNLQMAYDLGYNRKGRGGSWKNRALADTKVSLTVFNIFDREPPHVQGNAGFAVTDPRMARYVLTLRKSF